MSDKNIFKCIILYIFIGFMTHSYTIKYIYDDWLREYKSINGEYFAVDKTRNDCILSGVLWPMYWTSRGTSFLVDKLGEVKICFGDKND